MLYEDDFEFEEQPANIRDRAIPGSKPAGGGGGGRFGGGGGGRRGGNGGGGRGRGPGGPSRGRPLGVRDDKVYEMPENAKQPFALLEELLTKMGVTGADIRYIPRSEGEYLEINGPDLAMLIGRHGNTLEALNLLFNNMLNVGVRSNRRYYTIDAEGYRAHRAEVLKELALRTAERVVAKAVRSNSNRCFRRNGRSCISRSPIPNSFAPNPKAKSRSAASSSTRGSSVDLPSRTDRAHLHRAARVLGGLMLRVRLRYALDVVRGDGSLAVRRCDRCARVHLIRTADDRSRSSGLRWGMTFGFPGGTHPDGRDRFG